MLLSVIGEGTEFPLSFPDTVNLTFSVSCFLILSTLLSAVQYTLKILSWKMIFCTLEQLLKGILLELSVCKSTLAFHIHLAKCNSAHCSPVKQRKHICRPYTHSALCPAADAYTKKKAQRKGETLCRLRSLRLVEPRAAQSSQEQPLALPQEETRPRKPFPQRRMAKPRSSYSGRERGGGGRNFAGQKQRFLLLGNKGLEE